MKNLNALLFVVLLVAGARGQLAGTLTAEYHPPLSMQSCTSSGCSTLGTSVTIDANWRWVHNSASTNCFNGNSWDTKLCPDPVTCATNCALEGVNQAGYTSTYGISTTGTGLTLDYVTGSNVGSRVYMMADTNTYQMFKLKNREFTFDVDVAKLPCGLNGALYFVEMDADGGKSEYPGNKAGAQFGTGYCDAQCPQDIKFINGQANSNGWTGSGGMYGSCCTELDIWEANSISNAFTPHTCSVIGQTQCTGAACANGADNRYGGVCDKDGCDFNPFRMGNQTFYGPGMIINTNEPMTVVTQFITSDGTDSGDLVEIRRLYKQNGVVFYNSNANFAGLTGSNSITDDFCDAQKTLFGNSNEFAHLGGLKGMGEAMDRGMVLVMSLWDDAASNCLWLDSVYPTTAAASKPGVARGSCPPTSGVPSTLRSQSPSSRVTFSNIKVGTIGSTTNGVSGSSTPAPPKPTTNPKPTSAPTAKPTSAPTTTPKPATTPKPSTTPKPATTPKPTTSPKPTAAPKPTTKPPKPTKAPKPTATKAPAPKPVNPASSGCDASSITVSQSVANSWTQGPDTVTQYTVTVSTTCTTKQLVGLTLSASNWNPINSWGFTAQGSTVSLPSYISISPSSPISWMGYQNIGGEATFTVLSYTFQ